MPRRMHEIQRDAQDVAAEIDQIRETYGDEPPEGQIERADRLKLRAARLLVEFDEAQALRAERVDAVRDAAEKPGNRMSGSQPDSYAHDYGKVRGRDPWGAVREAGPFGLAPSDLRARALDAASIANVSDEVRERTTLLLEQAEDTALAEWVLPASDPHYRTAFRKILRDPYYAHMEFDPEEREAFRAAKDFQRAMSEGSNGAGAFLVPYSLDPAIQITNVGTLGDTVRDLCRVDVRATNVHHVITSAGVTAEWTAENQEASDASPSVLSPSIPLFPADAYLQASFEILQDTSFESDIGMLIADARAIHEASAHINGNGTTQPRGIVTALAATTASRVSSSTNGSFGAVDVFNLIGALPARYHRGAAWVAHPNMGYKIRQMATGTGQQAGTFWVDFEGENPSQLAGRRWAEASEMTASLSAATASTDNVLVVADFQRFYRIVDHPASVVIFEPLVKGSNQRPIGAAGWYFRWRTGGDVVNSDAARLLQV